MRILDRFKGILTAVMILWLFFAIALVLSAVSCTKYSVSEDQLVGRWQLESYQYKEYDKDGRLVLDGTYRSPLVLITILLKVI